MGIELPRDATTTPPAEKDAASRAKEALIRESQSQPPVARDRMVATTAGDKASSPDTTREVSGKPAAAAGVASDQPVYFDPAHGWHRKDANNQIVPFNTGGKPFYDQAKGTWVKPADGSTEPAHHPPLPEIHPPAVRPGTSDVSHPPRAADGPQTRPEIYHPREQKRPIEINSPQEFRDKVLNAKGPVFVDFSMDGCGPCNSMKGTVDNLAREYSGRAPVYVVPHSPEWAQQYAPGGYPTFKVFDPKAPGGIAGDFIGVTNPRQFRDTLNASLSHYAHDAAAPASPARPPERPPVETVPPDAPNRRPLEPFERSGFHNEKERDKFERWATKKGFSPQAIERSEHMTREEWSSFDAINAERIRLHHRPLKFSPRVKLISDMMADNQAEHNQIGHEFKQGRGRHPLADHFARFKLIDLGGAGPDMWTHGAENAGMGYQSGEAATAGWLGPQGSPDHKRAIRDQYLGMGAVSCARSRNGTPYWTYNAEMLAEQP